MFIFFTPKEELLYKRVLLWIFVFFVTSQPSIICMFLVNQYASENNTSLHKAFCALDFSEATKITANMERAYWGPAGSMCWD